MRDESGWPLLDASDEVSLFELRDGWSVAITAKGGMAWFEDAPSW